MTTTLTPPPRAAAGEDRRSTLAQPLHAPAWRIYLYVLLVTLLAVPGAAYLFCAGLTSALLLITLVGVPLLALVVLSGRWWNRLYRALARMVGVSIDEPAPFARPAGWPHALSAALTDAIGWRGLGFLTLTSLVMLPVGYLVLIGVTMALVLLASPVLWLVLGEAVVTLDEPVDSVGGYLLLAAGGLLALYLLAWFALAIGRAHLWLAATMLAPSDRDRRVVQLEQARADVVDESAATLRRVERDLHDGTQARLITVAMALARAEEHLQTPAEVQRGRELVSDALANTKETLTELRDLVRGIRPPALDLGLGPAVQTLVARNPVPVRLVDDIGVRPSLGIETMAYFCVAELLANVSRHSGATAATVWLHSDRHELRIAVADNGNGGIDPANGSGLTGLLDRLRMVDGRLDIESPVGGPTTVTAVVPVSAER